MCLILIYDADFPIHVHISIHIWHWLSVASDSTTQNLLKRRNSSRSQVRENVLNNLSLALALILLSLQRASSTALFQHAVCCCSLAPSCGAVQGNLLHLAQLCQQPLHAVFELRQTGQRFRRLQFPGVVKPALQH